MRKQKIIFIFLAILVLFNLNIAQGSTSDSFAVDDEAINFGSAGGYLTSDSFELDVNDVAWVSRYAASENYEIIDGNSIIDSEEIVVPIPVPGPVDGGSSGGPGGGSGVILPLIDADNPTVTLAEEPQVQELNNIISEDIENIKETEDQEEIVVLKQAALDFEEINLQYIDDLEELIKIEGLSDDTLILDFIQDKKQLMQMPLAVIANLSLLSELDSCNYYNRVMLPLLVLSVLFNLYLLWKIKEKKRKKRK